jgi:phosphoribosylaminoimidazole (AIR) synthetase
MLRTFNMGVGLIAVCAAADRERTLRVLADAGEPRAWRLGEVVAGEHAVRFLE